MHKKMSIIATISILIICLISSFVFATSGDSMLTNAVDDTANVINDGGQMVGNVIEDGGAMVGNVARDGAEMMSENMVNGNTAIANGIIDSQTIDDVGGDAKNAVETMTTGNILSGNSMSNYKILGLNLSVWMWIILIIIIIVVIVLICKYMQDHDDNNDDDDDE